MNIYLVDDKPPKDCDLGKHFQTTFSHYKAVWNDQRITDATSFSRCVKLLSSNTDPAIGLHDLHLELANGIALPLFGSANFNRSTFANAEHGAELLMTLAESGKRSGRETLLVVASSLAGRSRIQALHTWVAGLGAWNIHLTEVGDSFNCAGGIQEAKKIAEAWDDYFGCMANRIRASYTLGWFSDSGVPHPVMIHSFPSGNQISESARDELAQWISKMFQEPLSSVKKLLGNLKKAEATFYNNVPRHLCGDCALHSKKSGNKPINMHALAFIACAYANNVPEVFNNVNWAIPASQTLISDKTDASIAESLFYALVGRPDDQLQSTSLFGRLGFDTGQSGGKSGSKTVTKVILFANNVKITFGFDGRRLLKKLKDQEACGGANNSLLQLQQLLKPHGTELSYAATSKTFTITIKKP